MEDVLEYVYKVIVCACIIVSTVALVRLSLSVEEINQKVNMFDIVDHVWR